VAGGHGNSMKGRLARVLVHLVAVAAACLLAWAGALIAPAWA